WRYLTYPPESPQAKIAAQENHEGRGACYWYHDDRDQATRYLIPASGGLPCRHHDVALTGDGVVKTDKRWHIAPEELETEQRWGAEAVREIVGRGVAVPVFAFKVSDLLAVREALGH